MRYLWLIGLLIACASAIALLVLSVEVALLPALLGIVLGLVLFASGMFLRMQRDEEDIGTAMKRFAQTSGGEFQEALPADQLPASISLFRSGDRQRCTNVIALPCAGRTCMLFRFECYYRPRGGGAQGIWWDYYAAYVPQALPGCADFQVQLRFTTRGPLVLVVVLSLLVAVVSLLVFAFTGSTTSLVRYLLLSASALIFGSFVVLLARRGSQPAPAPAFLDEQILAQFAQQGLCVQCVEGNLAVWTERTIERLWRIGWNRSFRPVDEWVAEELRGLLEAARQVLSRADRAESQNSDGAKPGRTNGSS